MNHLESIGFKINSATEFEKLQQEIVAKGERIEVDGGAYLLYSDKSGAEIYAQVDCHNNFLGFMPFYKNALVKEVNIEGIVVYDDATPLDRRYQAMSLNKVYPFVFDVVNAKVRPLRATTKESLAFVAFPQEITYFETAEAFLEEFPELSTTYLIPVGLMTPEGGANPNPEPYMMFIGEIKKVELKQNSYSNGAFYQIDVTALDGDITIVCSKEQLKAEPKVGAYLNGVYWIGAKV